MSNVMPRLFFFLILSLAYGAMGQNHVVSVGAVSAISQPAKPITTLYPSTENSVAPLPGPRVYSEPVPAYSYRIEPSLSLNYRNPALYRRLDPLGADPGVNFKRQEPFKLPRPNYYPYITIGKIN